MLLSDPASRRWPLHLTRPSPPSGWPEDSHLQTAEHAQHTTNPLCGSSVVTTFAHRGPRETASARESRMSSTRAQGNPGFTPCARKRRMSSTQLLVLPPRIRREASLTYELS